jgi:hypothetical protein
MLRPCPAGALELWPVSPKLNDGRLDEPGLLARLESG